MPRFRTITTRFATVYAAMIGIMAVVCVVFLGNLTQVRMNSERAMEEARELVVLMRVISGVETIRTVLVHPDTFGATELRSTRDMVRKCIEQLEGLHPHTDDPSRQEHKENEARLGELLREDLEQIAAMLETGLQPEMMEPVHALLASAEEGAGVLRMEAQQETIEANRDLERRVYNMRLVIIGTLLMASLFLGFALLSVQVRVIRPLRILSSGAERFGAGDLEHRICVDNEDEIGDLARSLNLMADKLADTREDLEDRVRTGSREFVRAARIAHLGVLASGIAHEINTPLASISFCFEGLQRRLSEGSLSQELLAEYSETISREVYRARGITTRMLGLVREDPSICSNVPLALILEQVESALTYRAQQGRVQLVWHAPDHDVELWVNGGELVQIIVNLVANAVDAAPPDTEVTLRAATEDQQLILTVEDYGPGIPEESLDQIFEPFFTTKPPGEGTGLGLALVGTMVESHRGQVSVKSKLGKGSVFRVVLPLDWRPVA